MIEFPIRLNTKNDHSNYGLVRNQFEEMSPEKKANLKWPKSNLSNQ